MKGILSENSSIVDVVFLHVKRSLLVYIGIYCYISNKYYGFICTLCTHSNILLQKNDMAATDLIRFVESENQLQFSYTAYSQ